MDFSQVKPEQLQAAVTTNIEKQRQSTAQAVIKFVHEKLAARIESLNSGAEDRNPEEFRITIPAVHYNSSAQRAGVELALDQLKYNGFNVSLGTTPNLYEDDAIQFVFITKVK